MISDGDKVMSLNLVTFKLQQFSLLILALIISDQYGNRHLLEDIATMKVVMVSYSYFKIYTPQKLI